MNRFDGTTRISLVILLVAMARFSHGAVPISPELQQAGEAGRIREMHAQAEISLHDKIQVGKQRYQERQAYRQTLVEGMRANAEERREEISGEAPVRGLENEKKFDPSDAVWALLILAVVYQGIRYVRNRESEDIVFATPQFKEIVRARVEISQKESVDNDWKQTVRDAPLAPEHYAMVNFDGTVKSSRCKLGAINSVKLCLDISPTLSIAVPEARIKAHLKLLLERQGIRTEEKSEVWLALLIQGSRDEKNRTFTHEEKLVFIESGTFLKKSPVGEQPTPGILWSAENTGFADEADVENDILAVTEVFMAVFIKDLLSAQGQEPSLQSALYQ